MPVQLAPCPFCGGNNITINVLLPPFRAYCKDCGAEGPDSTISPEMALLYWNTAGCPGKQIGRASCRERVSFAV